MADNDLDMRRLQSDGAPFFGSLPPEYAGLMRGISLAVVMVVVKALIDYLTGNNPVPHGWDIYVPIMLAVLRSVEGLVDQHSVSAAKMTLAARAKRNR